MEKKREKKNRAGTHTGREAGTPSPSPQSRVEAEGERFLINLLALVEKYVPEAQRKAFEGLVEQGRRLLGQLNRSIEENAKGVVQRLGIPSKKDFEAYTKKLDASTKKLRENIDAGVKRGLSRLNFATRGELEELAKRVGRMGEEVDALRRRPAVRKKAAAGTSP